ncbi:hypothetical protein K458DRAFT_383729 [Lentithecium fluviatile CBS 122367]|uniref:Uncharacterized protein n=1 Tax=Lentithecium fluviatile CBS 122367 TaxID=1168545 RepID=A0A6G1JES1_9PLEO|nr:hypothetical protein K458DRAFT_383729 [Lentithecium fluviatile CBS 122367]
MRFLTRLHACVAAAFVLVLYFSWLRPSLRIHDNIQRVWKGTAHRVVVFGDDWSDTGKYRVAAPPKATTLDRDPSRGDIWVEALCKTLNCDFIDNYARSIPANVEMNTVGSVVAADVFANATREGRNETLVLFDFQTQVQQFIAFEEETRRRQIPDGVRKVDEWTVFTVFFGIWDLLEYSMLEKEAAIHAIDRSVDELMYNLDILADHVVGPVKVVMPKLVDVTFLPRYSNKKDKSATIFAQSQHQAVFLWTYWNMVLTRAANEWGNGDLFMPDLHGMIVNQVRSKQLYSKQISDATGWGKQTPLFDEVEQPCLAPKTDGSTGDLQAAAVEKCSNPANHLFWDDIRLSGPAHQLIGSEAARLLHVNITVNRDARDRAIQQGTKNTERKQHKGFDLKFPPGY